MRPARLDRRFGGRGGEGEDLTWSKLVALGPTWSQPCWPYGYIIYSKQIDHYGPSRVKLQWGESKNILCSIPICKGFM